MGFEHLIAAWFLSNREKKREKRQVVERTAAQREEKRQEQAVQQYLAGKGYDHKRQRYLTGLAKSSLREDRREFSRILGRPYCEQSDVAVEWAVRAIANREGWTYFRRDELIYDKEYCRLLDWMPPSREVIERFEDEVKDLKRKENLWQGWVERNPKCWDVNISPEFYDSEEAFSLVVEYEHEKKQWK